jgi:hypothetical protein
MYGFPASPLVQGNECALEAGIMATAASIAQEISEKWPFAAARLRLELFGACPQGVDLRSFRYNGRRGRRKQDRRRVCAARADDGGPPCRPQAGRVSSRPGFEVQL